MYPLPEPAIPFHLCCENGLNLTQVGRGPVRLMSLQMFTSSVNIRYLKFYDTADPSNLAALTPKLVFQCKAIGGQGNPQDYNLSGGGIRFEKGCYFVTTYYQTDADLTGVAQYDINLSGSYLPGLGL